MKEIYFIYNNLSNEYYLDFGRKFKNRNYLGKADKNKLVNILKKKMDFRRKSILHLENIPEEIGKTLIDFFKDTKIHVEIKKTR